MLPVSNSDTALCSSLDVAASMKKGVPTLSSDATFRLSAYLRKDRVPCWNSTMLAPGHVPPPASQALPSLLTQCSLRRISHHSCHDSPAALPPVKSYEGQRQPRKGWYGHILFIFAAPCLVQEGAKTRYLCALTAMSLDVPDHTRMQHDVALSCQHLSKQASQQRVKLAGRSPLRTAFCRRCRLWLVTLSGKVRIMATSMGTPTSLIARLGSGDMTVRPEKSTLLPERFPLKRPCLPLRRCTNPL